MHSFKEKLEAIKMEKTNMHIFYEGKLYPITITKKNIVKKKYYYGFVKPKYLGDVDTATTYIMLMHEMEKENNGTPLHKKR